MTGTKLSDSEKLEIIELYRETEENTVTLAERYGVSSSTIRRILQGAIPVEEYKALVQQKQKRSHGTQKGHSVSRQDKDADPEVGEELVEGVSTSTAQRRRKRSSSVFEAQSDRSISTDEEQESEDAALPKRDLEKIIEIGRASCRERV